MDSLTAIVIISVLGPVLGSLIGVLHSPGLRFTFNMLSFAAGIMLAISFIQLIPESVTLASAPVCALGIILGTFIMFALDRMIPHIHPETCTEEPGRNLNKTATFLVLGIFLHNFPEGMAIAMGSHADMRVSLTIALAIAIHNIPEGICTSASYYCVSGRRLKSFLVSSATAIPILIGFLVARFVFTTITDVAMGLIVGATAGLMIYISADELIPTACSEPAGHGSIFSLIVGVLFVVLLGG